jgi:hypothetical protein
MNQQDNQELNNQQALIEDLTVNDAQAEEVKGGAEVKTIRFKAGKDLPA